MSHSGELRKLLPGGCAICPPTVISSLQQLQSVTCSRKNRRRSNSCRFLLKDNLDYCTQTDTCDDGCVHSDADKACRASSTANGEDYTSLRFSVLCKPQRFIVTSTEDFITEEVEERSARVSPPTPEDTRIEETFGIASYNPSKWRRIYNSSTNSFTDNGKDEEGDKAFTSGDAPTRAPSQKSVASKCALPCTGLATDKLQNAVYTNRQILYTRSDFLPKNAGLAQPTGDGKVGHGGNSEGEETLHCDLPLIAMHTRSGRKIAADERTHTVVKRDPLETQNDGWRDRDAGATYPWENSSTEGSTLHQNVGNCGQLIRERSRSLQGEEKGKTVMTTGVESRKMPFTNYSSEMNTAGKSPVSHSQLWVEEEKGKGLPEKQRHADEIAVCVQNSPEHKQTIVAQSDLLGTRTAGCCATDARDNYTWEGSKTAGRVLHKNAGNFGQLTGRDSHSLKGRGEGKTKETFLVEYRKLFCERLNDSSENEKGGKPHSSTRQGVDDEERKGSPGGQLDANKNPISVQACQGEEETDFAVAPLDCESRRDSNAKTLNRVTLHLGEKRRPFSSDPFPVKPPAEAVDQYFTSRERKTFSDGTKQKTLAASEPAGERHGSGITSGGTSLTFLRLAQVHEKSRKPARSYGENCKRPVENQKAGSAGKASAFHSEALTTQDCFSEVARIAEQIAPEHCTVPMASRLFHSSSDWQADALRSPFMTELPFADPAEKGLSSAPSNAFSTTNYFIRTPASVSLYYHVHEASLHSSKNFSVENSAGTPQQSHRLYPVVRGVSRDNAKRRWAVYWQGNRRYFYDKLNENCYQAYLQAVSFRKYNYIQSSARSENFPVSTEGCFGHMKDKAAAKQLTSISLDASSSTKNFPVCSKQISGSSLREPLHSSQSFWSRRRNLSARCVSYLSTPPKDVAAPVSSPSAQLHDAQSAGSENCAPNQEQTPLPASGGKLPAAEEATAELGLLPTQFSGEGRHVDPVTDMYRTALLMVLADLKESLTCFSDSAALLGYSSSMEFFSEPFQACEGSVPQNRCLSTCKPADNTLRSSQRVGGAQKLGLKLRQFLLLVVEWHQDTVKSAVHQRELQPLLGVFSPCFQRLLLPRHTSRQFQQKIYRELTEILTTHALSYLIDV